MPADCQAAVGEGIGLRYWDLCQNSSHAPALYYPVGAIVSAHEPGRITPVAGSTLPQCSAIEGWMLRSRLLGLSHCSPYSLRYATLGGGDDDCTTIKLTQRTKPYGGLTDASLTECHSQYADQATQTLQRWSRAARATLIAASSIRSRMDCLNRANDQDRQSPRHLDFLKPHERP